MFESSVSIDDFATIKQLDDLSKSSLVTRSNIRRIRPVSRGN
jgi:hypothetical protein